MEPLHKPGKVQDRDGPEAGSRSSKKKKKKKKKKTTKKKQKKNKQTKNRHRNTSSVTDMLADLHWETLETRRAKSQLILMLKILHGLMDVPAAVPTRTRCHYTMKPIQYASSTDTTKYRCGTPLTFLLTFSMYHSIVEQFSRYLS